MSIALVIIALLVGAVVMGKDLIIFATIKKQISQIESITTAVNAFKLKYNCLPGDCANAEQYGLGSSSGPGQNGNGDGAVSTNSGSFNTVGSLTGYRSYESLNFWYHLSQSSMFENNLTGYTGQASFTPEMRAESMLASIISSDTVIIPTYFGTIGANSKAGGGNGFYFASLSNPYAGKASVPSQLTDMMDRKIDDGHPQNGKMLCGQDGSPRLALVYLPSGGTNCIYTSYPSELCNRWGNSTAYFVGSDGMCSFGLTNKF